MVGVDSAYAAEPVFRPHGTELIEAKGFLTASHAQAG
jgi:hypothetical protein